MSSNEADAAPYFGPYRAPDTGGSHGAVNPREIQHAHARTSRWGQEPLPLSDRRIVASESQLVAPKMRSATTFAASSSRPGTTWLYVSSVMWIVEWPRRSDTTLG